MQEIPAHGSYPKRQDQPTAAGSCLWSGALSLRAACQVQTSAVKVILVLVAAAVEVLYRRPSPLGVVVALTVSDSGVVGAGLVHCPRTAQNLLCHFVRVSQTVALYRPGACLVPGLKAVFASLAACCH